MRGCASGTMSAESWRRAVQLVQNYRGTTVLPSQEKRAALAKTITQRVFSR